MMSKMSKQQRTGLFNYKVINMLLIYMVLICQVKSVYALENNVKQASANPAHQFSCQVKSRPEQISRGPVILKKGANSGINTDPDCFKSGARLTISQAINLTIKNNLQLRARKEKIVQARSQFEQVNSHLNVKSSIEGRSQLQGPQRSLADISPFPIPDGIDGATTVMWGFDATGRVKVEKILSSFGKIEHQKAAAFIRIEAERQSLRTLENNVRFQVKQAFYNVLKASEALKVAKEFATLAGEYQDQAKKLYKAGIVSKFDVLKADVSVAEARKNVISAEKAVALSKSVLLILMDQRMDRDFNVKAPDQVLLKRTVNLESLQTEAVKNRSELREITTYVDVARKLLEAAKANNKPDLLASGEVGMQANPMGKGIVDNYAWNVGLSIRIPITDGGETTAKRKEALSNLRELKLNHEALAQQVSLQVKEAWLNYREARIKVDVVRSELLKSRESYFLAKARYSEGISIAVEMNEALVSYNNSKKNLINALYDFNLAIAMLEKSTGKKFDQSSFTTIPSKNPPMPGVDIYEKIKPEENHHEK